MTCVCNTDTPVTKTNNQLTYFARQTKPHRCRGQDAVLRCEQYGRSTTITMKLSFLVSLISRRRHVSVGRSPLQTQHGSIMLQSRRRRPVGHNARPLEGGGIAGE